MAGISATILAVVSVREEIERLAPERRSVDDGPGEIDRRPAPLVMSGLIALRRIAPGSRAEQLQTCRTFLKSRAFLQAEI